MNHAIQAMKDRGERMRKMGMPKMPDYSYRGQDEKDPSLVTRVGDTFAKKDQFYTGDAIVGIAQMAKSNAIPVFSKQDAIDVARMRR